MASSSRARATGSWKRRPIRWIPKLVAFLGNQGTRRRRNSSGAACDLAVLDPCLAPPNRRCPFARNRTSADHVDSATCPRRKASAGGARPGLPGEITACSCTDRRRRDRRHRALPEGHRPAGHHRRRVPPHLLSCRLPAAARRRGDQAAVPRLSTPTARRPGAAIDAWSARCATRKTSRRPTSRSSRRSRPGHTPKVTIPSPTMLPFAKKPLCRPAHHQT